MSYVVRVTYSRHETNRDGEDTILTDSVSFWCKDRFLLYVERFSNDCRKTKTKAITPTNHKRNKQRHETNHNS